MPQSSARGENERRGCVFLDVIQVNNLYHIIMICYQKILKCSKFHNLDLELSSPSKMLDVHLRVNKMNSCGKLDCCN